MKYSSLKRCCNNCEKNRNNETKKKTSNGRYCYFFENKHIVKIKPLFIPKEYE